MKVIILLALILFSHNVPAQLIGVENKPSSEIEQSDNLLIKAGYAYRQNDFDEALKLYKQAQTLNPKNEIVKTLIKSVEKNINDKKLNPYHQK